MLRPLPPLQNKGGRRRLGVSLAVAAAILLLFFGGSFVLSLAGPVAHDLAAPVFRAGGALKEATLLAGRSLFSAKVSLVRENEDLRRRLAAADAESLERLVLFEENAALKKLLGREAEGEAVLATVLSRPNHSPYDTLLIDIGADHGLRAGDHVTAYGEVVIGRVGAVYEKSALVKLFSAPGEEQQVFVGSSTPAKAVGVGGGNFRIVLPKGVPVAIGDPVVLPSIGTRIFGRVEEIEAGSSDTFQRVLFQSPVNIFELRWVEVLRS